MADALPDPGAPQSAMVAALVEGMTQIGEAVKVLLDGVDGYRQDCLRRGYSETAAEVMAMEYHSAMMKTLMGGTSK